MMPSFGELLDADEARLFVGREPELIAFQQWLKSDAGPAQLWNVSGPGGVGKSALLRAFRRIADEQGRPVILIDGRDLRPTPEGLHSALAQAVGLVSGRLGGPAEGLSAVVAELNQQSPLLLFDTFEELGDLTRYLRDRLLGDLDASVRVVIAGRYPLGHLWRQDDAWHRLIHPLPLTGFTSTEAQHYLARHDLPPTVVEDIVRAVGGLPLALALAADVVSQRKVRSLNDTPDWHVAVHGLVERLLADVDDPQLRDLLVAGAMVRQFDEATLAALVGEDQATAAFDRLYHLAVVRPTAHGLMLHDDVRRILADDLRWRHPERYRELRVRALAHYRARMTSAPPEEHEYLLAERFFQWGHSLAQALLFGKDEPGLVWVEPGRAEDHDDVVRIWLRWLESGLSVRLPIEFDVEEARIEMEGLLAQTGPRLRLARDVDGQAVGFSMVIPIAQDSFDLLLRTAAGGLVRAFWDPGNRSALPAQAEQTDAFFLTHLAVGDWEPEAVNAALLRDLLGLLARGGLYLISTIAPHYKQLLQALGFHLVPEARAWGYSRVHPLDGFALDLRATGLETWLESLVAGGPPILDGLSGPPSGPAAGARPPNQASVPILTRREWDVATLVARGRTNREIAAELIIGERTVDTHVQHILAKLQVSTRTQIATWIVAQPPFGSQL